MQQLLFKLKNEWFIGKFTHQISTKTFARLIPREENWISEFGEWTEGTRLHSDLWVGECIHPGRLPQQETVEGGGGISHLNLFLTILKLEVQESGWAGCSEVSLPGLPSIPLLSGPHVAFCLLSVPLIRKGTGGTRLEPSLRSYSILITHPNIIKVTYKFGIDALPATTRNSPLPLWRL